MAFSYYVSKMRCWGSPTKQNEMDVEHAKSWTCDVGDIFDTGVRSAHPTIVLPSLFCALA